MHVTFIGNIYLFLARIKVVVSVKVSACNLLIF